jgi:transglutaminase-like putative cysteine protease
MEFQVRHVTCYDYNAPITLAPHLIRLRPRCDGSLLLRAHTLQIEPEPVGLDMQLDAEGNAVAQVWFEGETCRMRVESRFEAQTLRGNAYDFLLPPREATGRYDAILNTRLAPYLRADPAARETAAFAGRLMRETDGDTLAFVTALNATLHERIAREIRETGDPQKADRTLALKRGACRDLTVLFIAACRHQGIAARFVSGYQKGDTRRERRYLHAWPEVYLPGGGWRGFDPTHGTAVADEHVAVAAAADPAGAAPIEGGFYGQAGSRLSTELQIEVR